jgi:2-dehydro-3-deoxyphosphogluconate aldolase/(4S)-4-hydroxy-2-oxoglutarate aldolase
MRFLERMSVAIIPVIVIEHAHDAVPLARALAAGGLTTLEVTLRTPAALEAIGLIAEQVPQVQVGAGTVLGPDDVRNAWRAGARFAFAPGLARETVNAARDNGLEFIPGVMTPSEITAALALDCRMLKFFPAGPAGGPPMLKAFASPFAAARFCPTGGIGVAQLADYLALPNVFAVGGSWMIPPALLEARDWPAIESLAAQAVRLARAAPSDTLASPAVSGNPFSGPRR